MINKEALEKLAKQYQMGIFPNIIREYFQHVFLAELYKLPESSKLLFKGGTALRIVYGSPRFSEDLDFSLFDIPPKKALAFVENLFIKVLDQMSQVGIKVELGNKIGITSGGYFGFASFKMLDYPSVNVEINISNRDEKKLTGEIDSIANNFVPIYNIIHLSQVYLVDEKIFGALMERKKPRDFYDLYLIMRKNMLSVEQKKRLGVIKDNIISEAKKINFRTELGLFLPADQQGIARDFIKTLERELKNQLG